MTMLDLGTIEDELLDWRFKGCPPRAYGSRIGDIGRLGLNVLGEDTSFPVAVLKRAALDNNRRWMREFLRATRANICPHGKTSMAPQLFQRQLEDGAWGMTAATVTHLRVYRAHGVQRIFFANQLIAAADIEYVLEEMARDPAFDFYCLVDSREGLERLAAAARAHRPGRPLQVLVEVGASGGRTGVRSIEAGVELCREVAGHAPTIVLRGIEAFEGIFGGYDHQALEGVGAMLERVVALARAAEGAGCFAAGEVLLSAGGSAFFDLVAEGLSQASLRAETRVLLRSGCYLTHDSHHYEIYLEQLRQRSPVALAIGERLQPALEIWARVQSIPEPGLAIVNFGKRDASHDIDLPKPLWWFRPGEHARPLPVVEQAVSRLNDQHAYVTVSSGRSLRVGDLMGFGISHPCTTFDKWQLLLEVDDRYEVVGAIRTFF